MIYQQRRQLRLSTLLRLKESKDEKMCIVTTPEACLMSLLNTFVDNTCMLKVGDRYDYQELVQQLTEHLNYDTEAACENAEIAIRSGIIDIYPANEQQPYRVDFFGDEIKIHQDL